MSPLRPHGPLNTRAFARLPVRLEVRYASDSQLREAYIESLSGGGVFIRTSSPLPIGSEIEMEIRIEGEAQPLTLRGKVVWERLYKDRYTPAGQGSAAKEPEGMGVQFLDPLPPSLARLLGRPA